LDPRVYDVFDSESAVELNPEIVALTPGTLCIGTRMFIFQDTMYVISAYEPPSHLLQYLANNTVL